MRAWQDALSYKAVGHKTKYISERRMKMIFKTAEASNVMPKRKRNNEELSQPVQQGRKERRG